MGPYQTKDHALTEPLFQEIRALHTADRVSTGSPARLATSTALAHLEAARADAGIELGAYDRLILALLAEWGVTHVQVVIGLLSRANTTT